MKYFDNLDELELIAGSVRRDRCQDARLKNHNKTFWADCSRSANQTREVDLKPGNRLRMSARTPSLPKLKFMQGD